MKADIEHIIQELAGMEMNAVLDYVRSVLTKLEESAAAAKANQDLLTECHRQNTDLSEKNRKLMDEVARLKELYKKELDKNTLCVERDFGQKSEKLGTISESSQNPTETPPEITGEEPEKEPEKEKKAPAAVKSSRAHLTGK